MLETPLVFVDAEPFYAAHFQFGEGTLKRLKDLAVAGRLRVVLPSVTKLELEKKLLDRFDEAATRLQGLQNKGRILANSDTQVANAIFCQFDRQVVENELLAKLHDYLGEVNVVDIAHANGALERVLDKYFDGKAPFGSGQKKHEFPDAIAADSLARFCIQEDQSVYIVSRDPDWEETCKTSDRFLYMESLAELFRLIEAVNAKAEALVHERQEQIRRQIRSNFEWGGFFLEDEDGEVLSVNVTDIELHGIKLDEISERRILFTAQATILYQADIEYGDQDTAIYDNEDRRTIYIRKIERVIDRELSVDVYGELEAASEDLEETLDVRVDLDVGRVVSVPAHENDYLY